jgi:GT2 family glycosyltransferase
MSATPAVSVCIRAFRRPEGLRAAIESVLCQTYQDFELIVSDDSGDMESTTHSFGDPRVRYVRNPAPAGHVANIVTSFGLARGRMLALLDDDDRWLPGFLEATVAALDGDPTAGIAFTDMYLEAGERRMRRRAAVSAGRHHSFLRQVLEDCPVVPSAALMRREVWEAGERDYPLDPSAVGDLTMWIRAALAGWPFHYVDEPLAVYRLHRAQLSWRPEIASRPIRVYERFSFDDPECERLRRARLAEARLAYAGLLLSRGRLREARREVARARSVMPGRMGARGWVALARLRPRVAKVLAATPRLELTVLRAWRGLRLPVYPGGPLGAGIEGWLGQREARALHEAAFRHAHATPELAAVEIGSWKGRSTVALATGLKRGGAGLLHAVDPHEGMNTHALMNEESTWATLRENVRDAGVESYVRVVRDLSTCASARFSEQSVGLLFLDGSHRYEDVLGDIEAWLPRLADGATVAFHDAATYPGVRRALFERVLGARPGFDRPRLVEDTLFVTRALHERSLGRSHWARRRGKLLLLRRRWWTAAKTSVRVALGGKRKR